MSNSADSSRDAHRVSFPMGRYLAGLAIAMLCCFGVSEYGLSSVQDLQDENQLLSEKNEQLVQNLNTSAREIKNLQVQNVEMSKALMDRDEKAVHCFQLGDTEARVIYALGPPISAYYQLESDDDCDHKAKRDMVRTLDYGNGREIYLDKKSGVYSYVDMGKDLCHR